MAMGKKRWRGQQPIWIANQELPRTRGHVFYDRVNEILKSEKFDEFAEKECVSFYKSERRGRPSIAPGVYFRMVMIGYFEGIDSERGIAWRCGDSLSLKSFLGYALTETTPDHSTISRTRRLIDLETHSRVFTWMLEVLARHGLVNGQNGRHRRDDIGGECGDAFDCSEGHGRKLHGFSDEAGPSQRNRDADARRFGEIGSEQSEEGFQRGMGTSG